MVSLNSNELVLAFVAVAFGTLALFLAREILLDRRRWRGLRAKLECLRTPPPDRIIVGEARGAQLETMTSMANLNPPEWAMRNRLAGAMQVIVHVARLLDRKRKGMNVSEIVGPTGVRPRFAGRPERYEVGLSGLLFTESPDKRANGGDHTW